MEVLVTGGAGFIGSNLVESLVERGVKVTVLDDLSTGSKENLEEVYDQIGFIQASCSEIPSLDFEGLDLIFHLGIPSSSPMYEDNESKVTTAIRDFVKILKYARKYDSTVVFASSSSVYGGLIPPHSEDDPIRPLTHYTETRFLMERMARVQAEKYDLDIVPLRLFSVYGSDERKGEYANVITQMIANDEFEIYGDGTQTRDFIHIDDVVNCFMKAAKLSEGFEIINVGTGVETSFNEVAEIVRKFGDLKTSYVENPINNYVHRTRADTSKMHRLLGEHSVSLEEGVKRTYKKLKGGEKIES